MVDTKKEQEREELHRAIWAIADELRGAVDGWGFQELCSWYYVAIDIFPRISLLTLTAVRSRLEIQSLLCQR